MGDRKKHKDREREKSKERKKKEKKEKEEKKKKKKDRKRDYSSDSDSDTPSETPSDSSEESRSRSKHKKKKEKSKKIKKEKKPKRTSEPKEKAPSMSNIPYDFSTVPAAFTAPIPGLKGLPIPAVPPPAPPTSNTASAPKLKSKQPNIFKLLPRLPYGCVLWAKTIFSGEYMRDEIQDQLLIEMAQKVEQCTKEEQHKKGNATINKCLTELEKIMKEEKEEREKGMDEGQSEQNNRYDRLRRINQEHTQRILNSHNSSQ